MAIALAGTMIFFLSACGGEGEREGEGAAKAPERVEVIGGERVIKLSREEQEKAGIVTTVLAGRSVERTERAYGTVMAVTELIQTGERLIAAMEGQERAEAAVKASRPEYERLKKLHADDRNASAKALEAAEAAFKADEAGARAAGGILAAAQNGCRAQWGGAICGWMAGPDPALTRLLQGQDALVLVTLAADSGLASAPARALVQAGAGNSVEAALISASPRMDERIQGRAYFYVAPGPSFLLPGANVTALVGTGKAERGCVVPRSAAVWWEGKAWVYEEKEPGQFIRKELPAGRPAAQGWVVDEGQWAGHRVVIQGAEQLLSEEFRSQMRAEEDED